MIKSLILILICIATGVIVCTGQTKAVSEENSTTISTLEPNTNLNYQGGKGTTTSIMGVVTHPPEHSEDIKETNGSNTATSHSKKGRQPCTAHDLRLFQAIAAGNKAKVSDILMDDGYDMECLFDYGYSALHFAITKRESDIAKILIDYGADINALDNQGNTPIMIAIVVREPSIVSYLIENGADLGIYDANGKSVYDLALESKDDEILALLKLKSPSEILKVCFATGCSGEICASEKTDSDCEFRPEHACYVCYDCQNLSGNCAWVRKADFEQCLQKNPYCVSFKLETK